MSDALRDEIITKALRRAYSLGQTYWQQADSESYSQNKKADATDRTFQALIADTRAALSAPPPVVPAAPRPVAYLMREAAGRIELWLMVQDQQGALKPLGDTGPIRVPDDWREAVQKHEAQAAAPQAPTQREGD